MNEIKKTKNKAFTTMILGFFVCFFMVGMYIITNNVSTSYALPISLDAKDINEITTKTQKYYKSIQTDEIVTFDKGTQVDRTQYTDYGHSIAESTEQRQYYTLGTKFVGTVNVDASTVYQLDMFCLEILNDIKM